MEAAVASAAQAAPAGRPAFTQFGITMKPVVSSQIDAIGHDPETSTLAVQFKPKAGSDQPGSIYHYQNVDAEKFATFAGAESIGSHFYKHIKPNSEQFPYTRML